MKDHTQYRNVHREPTIISPRGELTNHHWTEDGLIGERVKPEEATHFIVHTTTVEPA